MAWGCDGWERPLKWRLGAWGLLFGGVVAVMASVQLLLLFTMLDRMSADALGDWRRYFLLLAPVTFLVALWPTLRWVGMLVLLPLIGVSVTKAIWFLWLMAYLPPERLPTLPLVFLPEGLVLALLFWSWGFRWRHIAAVIGMLLVGLAPVSYRFFYLTMDSNHLVDARGNILNPPPDEE